MDIFTPIMRMNCAQKDDLRRLTYMERTKQCVNTRKIRYAEVTYCARTLFYIFYVEMLLFVKLLTSQRP
jgi:hypothetical protein